MAYFYQHIKGLTSGGHSWKLNFDQIDVTTSGVMITPVLTKDDLDTGFGNLITSNMANGVINNPFKFNSSVNVMGDFRNDQSTQAAYLNKIYFSQNGSSLYNGYIEYLSTGVHMATSSANELTFENFGSGKLTFKNNQVKFEGSSNTTVGFWTGKVYYQHPSGYTDESLLYNNPLAFALHDTNNVYKGFYLNSTDSSISNVQAYFNVPINATYFNATSDKRAKTGINQSTFSALGIIKSLPIYNFKYKSDGSDSIGIIAQEALKVDAGNFSLVANSQASGENGDYMSVKESKLVYVAWKAIQEQQEIIDKQSKEIEELKQLVKTLIQK